MTATAKRKLKLVNHRAVWTDANIKRLKTIYPKLSNAEVATRLGRTVDSVIKTANQLGLRKSATYLERMGRRNVAIRWAS